MLSPTFQIADSQLPFLAPSPLFQSSPQPIVNGLPPARKTPPPRLMIIHLPNLSDVINSQLINKSPKSPSPPQPSRNRRQKNVNPPRRLEDYYLGAVGENSIGNCPNNNFFNEDDITIGYSYPNYSYSIPSPSTNLLYSTSNFTRRTVSSLLRRPNRPSRHRSRRQRNPMPLAIDANYHAFAGYVASPTRSALVAAPAISWSSASTFA